MHFFGSLGLLMFLLGLLSTAWILGSKLYHLASHQPAPLVAEQPLFFIALTAMVIGAQLFLAGFVAELVSRNSPERNQYRVADRIGFGA
jgi:hypothetical protein